MKLATSVIVLFAATTLAGATEALSDLDDLEAYNATAFDDPAESFDLEKRRSCSGHRKNNEVCQGNFIARMNSRHNWYAYSYYGPVILLISPLATELLICCLAITARAAAALKTRTATTESPSRMGIRRERIAGTALLGGVRWRGPSFLINRSG